MRLCLSSFCVRRDLEQHIEKITVSHIASTRTYKNHWKCVFVFFRSTDESFLFEVDFRHLCPPQTKHKFGFMTSAGDKNLNRLRKLWLYFQIWNLLFTCCSMLLFSWNVFFNFTFVEDVSRSNYNFVLIYKFSLRFLWRMSFERASFKSFVHISRRFQF